MLSAESQEPRLDSQDTSRERACSGHGDRVSPWIDLALTGSACLVRDPSEQACLIELVPRGHEHHRMACLVRATGPNKRATG